MSYDDVWEIYHPFLKCYDKETSMRVLTVSFPSEDWKVQKHLEIWSQVPETKGKVQLL